MAGVTSSKEMLPTALLEAKLKEILETLLRVKGDDDTNWNLASLITGLSVKENKPPKANVVSLRPGVKDFYIHTHTHTHTRRG